MENTQNKYALITGATSGIGYELAKLFANDKYNLVIVARSQDELTKTASELSQQYGIQVVPIAKDLFKREEIEEAAEESELEPLGARNAEREEESIAELERCFSESDLEGAVRECVRLRYWVNIRESISNWEPGKPVVLEH